MSFVAIFDWHYGYYSILRVIVFFVCGGNAIHFYNEFDKQKKATPWWVWALACSALLFNPFLPVHLTRGIWSVFNIAVGFLLLYITKKYK